jgi:hypothetical protein
VKDITFFIYDDTENRFDNAKNNVKKHLLNEFNIDKDSKYFVTTDDHPSGDDCMCVTVTFLKSEIKGKVIKSFLGHTVESLEQRKERPKPKKKPNRKTIRTKPQNTSKD